MTLNLILHREVMGEIRANDQRESSKILDHRTGGFKLSTDDT